MNDSPKTGRGRMARDRIVAAASELIGERGVAETSIDDVLTLAGASKGQLYHYFEDRAALLRAVVLHNADGVDCEPQPLDRPADGQVLTCCSRPRTDITLDL